MQEAQKFTEYLQSREKKETIFSRDLSCCVKLRIITTIKKELPSMDQINSRDDALFEALSRKKKRENGKSFVRL